MKDILKNKKILLVLTIILGLGISLSAVYYIYYKKDSRTSSITSGLISIDFKEKSNVILSSNVPVIDDVGLEGTPYEFSVENTSIVQIKGTIKLNVISNTIPLGAVRYGMYINDELVKKDYVHDDKILYEIEEILVNEKLECKIYFWVDYYYDQPNKTFDAKIVVEGESFDALEGEYIKINYIEDLVDLSNEVNNGDTKQNKNYVLMRNLDFKNSESYRDATSTTYGDINGNGTVETLISELTNDCETCGGFIPIGKDGYLFEGSFDGNNYQIDNIYENNVNKTQSTGQLGLFGVIKNSNISNLTIGGNLYINTINNAGGIVGTTKGTTKINNCHNYTNLTSIFPNYSIGGIVGVNDLNLIIENSSNSGIVSGSNNAGGLAGYSGGTLLIKNSYNEGNITNSKGANVGGILGRDNASSNSTTIINSYNKGIVTSDFETVSTGKNIGGLVGIIYGTINIKDSHNEGEVISTTSSANVEIDNGGILGRLYGTGIIENSYNSNIITGGNRTGGIVGISSTNSNLILNKVYNTGTIYSNTTSTGDYNAVSGGLIGHTWRSNTRIINSYNASSVAGIRGDGIVGSTGGNNQDIIKILNSYNIGSISSRSSYETSGIVMLASTINKGILNNVYNLGTLTGNVNTAGISFAQSGIDASKVTLSNAYYLNNVSTGVSGVTSLNQYTTSMTEADMKSQTFVNTLNNNLKSIDLSEIDESLSGYTLSKWKLGKNGYPVFDWQE